MLKIVDKLNSSVWGRARTFLIIDRGPALPHLYVWGFGRSGTTWVQQALSLPYDLRPVFEPWHKEKTRGRYINDDQFISPNDERPDLKEKAGLVFSGRVHHKWIDASCPVGIYQGRVIKEVRGAFFLSWLKKQYASVPFLFLVRNPFNVTSSRKKILFEEGQDLNKIDKLVPGFLKAHQSLQTHLAKEILVWAISNVTPLAQSPRGSFDKVFYEDLLDYSELKFLKLGEKYSLGIADQAKLKEICVKDSPTDFLKRRGKRVFSEDLTATEQEEGMRVLEFFGLSKLYSETAKGLDMNMSYLDAYEGIGIAGLRERLSSFKGLQPNTYDRQVHDNMADPNT